MDTKLIKGYWDASRELAQAIPAQDDVTLTALMRVPEAVVFEEVQGDEEAIKNVALSAGYGAVERLITSRETEGKRIGEDIMARVQTLKNIVQDVQSREGEVEKEYAIKLRAKLNQAIEGVDIDENRLATEVLYFVDKSSITEELVRLNSHLKECENMLLSGEPVGRSLDFIVQELNREFNTIGSKSSDVTITKNVIDAKSEVEKIREQVQNVE